MAGKMMAVWRIPEVNKIGIGVGSVVCCSVDITTGSPGS